jgi:hypothetical protein
MVRSAGETFGKQCTPVPYGAGARVRCRAEVSPCPVQHSRWGGPTD